MKKDKKMTVMTKVWCRQCKARVGNTPFLHIAPTFVNSDSTTFKLNYHFETIFAILQSRLKLILGSWFFPRMNILAFKVVLSKVDVTSHDEFLIWMNSSCVDWWFLHGFFSASTFSSSFLLISSNFQQQKLFLRSQNWTKYPSQVEPWQLGTKC